MHIESVDTPSLLALWAIVTRRLQAYGDFEGCTAADRRMILAQAYLVIRHLTAGNAGRTIYLTYLCPPSTGRATRRCSTPWRACVQGKLRHY